MNQWGAVSVRAPGGLFGVKPDEMVWLTDAWLRRQAKASRHDVHDAAQYIDNLPLPALRVIMPWLPALEGETFDLVQHLHRQRRFSAATFGPGARTKGVVDHLRRELDEVLAAPTDLSEWVDLILLSFDGAWRAGHEPEAIAQAIAAKQAKNEARTWPDWRTADPDRAIEHVRAGEVPDVR